MSEYIIENKEEFRMMLRRIFEDDEIEKDSVDREEAELMMIIEEYRGEGHFKAVCAQTNNLVGYYMKQERFDTALEKVEGNISRLVTMDVRWYLFIARVMKAEILMGNNNPENSRKEIEKAFEVIPDDIALWKLGVGTRREYYERGMKLRTIVNSE